MTELIAGVTQEMALEERELDRNQVEALKAFLTNQSYGPTAQNLLVAAHIGLMDPGQDVSRYPLQGLSREEHLSYLAAHWQQTLTRCLEQPGSDWPEETASPATFAQHLTHPAVVDYLLRIDPDFDPADYETIKETYEVITGHKIGEDPAVDIDERDSTAVRGVLATVVMHPSSRRKQPRIGGGNNMGRGC